MKTRTIVHPIGKSKRKFAPALAVGVTLGWDGPGWPQTDMCSGHLSESPLRISPVISTHLSPLVLDPRMKDRQTHLTLSFAGK